MAAKRRHETPRDKPKSLCGFGASTNGTTTLVPDVIVLSLRNEL